MIRDVRANRRTFVPVSLSPSSGRKAGRRVFVENRCAKKGSSNLTGVFARERNRRRKHVRRSGIVDADTESDVNRKLHPGEFARARANRPVTTLSPLPVCTRLLRAGFLEQTTTDSRVPEQWRRLRVRRYRRIRHSLAARLCRRAVNEHVGQRRRRRIEKTNFTARGYESIASTRLTSRSSRRRSPCVRERRGGFVAR